MRSRAIEQLQSQWADARSTSLYEMKHSRLIKLFQSTGGRPESLLQSNMFALAQSEYPRALSAVRAFALQRSDYSRAFGPL